MVNGFTVCNAPNFLIVNVAPTPASTTLQIPHWVAQLPGQQVSQPRFPQHMLE